MAINKRLINTGSATPAPIDPLANFETVTYTGNGGTQAINGYIRKGAAFNGTSSYIDTNTKFTPQLMSFSAWVNPSVDNVYGAVFSNRAGASTYYGIDFGITNAGKIYSRFTTPSGSGNSGSNTILLPKETWTQIGFTISGSTAIVYKNGAAEYTVSSIGTIPNTLNFHIGKQSGASGTYFNGKIDQVRLFNTAITAANVSTLYAETYASATKSTTDIFGNGSGVALYELDDNSLSSNFGQAAVFNGSSSRINTGFLQNGQVYGISFWAKNLNGDSIFRDTPSTGGGDTRMDVTVSATKGVALGGGINLIPSFTPSTNTWNHYAVSLNGSTAKIYANGTEVGSKSYTPRTGAAGSITPGSGNHPVCMMSNGLFAAGFGSGSLDQVRVYSSALSTADITKLYQESNQIPTTNLVSHYTLNGNALDSAGSNNGTETSITYAGGVYGGTDIAINYLGMAFKPDLIWIKERGGNDRHILIDSIRGKNSQISSNSTAAETTYSSNLTSFDSNGFTLGSASESNGTNDTYVAWCWRAAASNATNNDGTIQSTVRANVEAGFSIVKWTTSSQLDTVGHGLDSAPELIIGKGINWSSSWPVYALPVGNDKKMSLNDNIAAHTSTIWGDTTPTDTTFKQDFTGTANRTSIAYCFHSVAGYQKVGFYMGTGGGFTVPCGFRPRFVMIKRVDGGSGNWVIIDEQRGSGGNRLYANLANGENAAQGESFSNNGFSPRDSATSDTNISGAKFIFLAIA